MKYPQYIILFFFLAVKYSPTYGQQLLGKCIDGNCTTGNGTMVTKIGEEYNGAFVNRKRNGNGKFKYNDGSIYNGFWKNDKREGLGIYTFKDGRVFAGKFIANEGNGKLKTVDAKLQLGELSDLNIFTPNRTAFNTLVKELKKSVISIKYTPTIPMGTGFIIANKYFATNKHVADILTNHHGNSTTAVLQMYDSIYLNFPITMVFQHPEIDLAIFRITGNISFPYPALEILDINPPVNSNVFTIGGTTISVKEGKIKNIARTTLSDGIQNYTGQVLTSDASAYPGDSGSPLFDETGKVISIICWATPESTAISFTLTGQVRRDILLVLPQ